MGSVCAMAPPEAQLDSPPHFCSCTYSAACHFALPWLPNSMQLFGLLMPRLAPGLCQLASRVARRLDEPSRQQACQCLPPTGGAHYGRQCMPQRMLHAAPPRTRRQQCSIRLSAGAGATAACKLRRGRQPRRHALRHRLHASGSSTHTEQVRGEALHCAAARVRSLPGLTEGSAASRQPCAAGESSWYHVLLPGTHASRPGPGASRAPGPDGCSRRQWPTAASTGGAYMRRSCASLPAGFGAGEPRERP